ncbi:MAG TPA: putative sugar nucleotidyl transferase, partial [Parasegetibacter sp.]
MQRIIFSEEYCRHQHLYPFTYIRQMVDIRVGILTIREKWEKLLGVPSADKWEDTYKDGPGAVKIHPEMEEDDCLLLHSNIIPTRELADAVLQLKPGQALSSKDHSGFAFRFTRKQILGLHKVKVEEMLEFEGQVQELQHPWQLFEWNDQEIRKDFQLITNGRKSAQAGESNKLYHPDNIFIEPGAVITGASLNAKTGPIYIGKNAEVMEGALIRGSFALCDNAVVKMGTKIYGATTVGPYSVVGGEIKNSILMGYSNKAHDGYLGDAVIGEWCNIGAGSSCSNLKNNASSVRIWNYYT